MVDIVSIMVIVIEVPALLHQKHQPWMHALSMVTPNGPGRASPPRSQREDRSNHVERESNTQALPPPEQLLGQRIPVVTGVMRPETRRSFNTPANEMAS